MFLFRRQEEITAEREEIDRQKKLLLKRRPSNSETGRKRNSSNQGNTAAAALHNGTDSSATFLKPDAIREFSMQEYYEADEILKVKILVSSSLYPSIINEKQVIICTFP